MLREVKEKLNNLFKKNKPAPSNNESAGGSIPSAVTSDSSEQDQNLPQKKVLKIREDEDQRPLSPKEQELTRRFDTSSHKLQAMDTLIIRDAVNPVKKPWWKVILLDIANGIMTVLLIFTSFGLLAESYFYPAHPYLAWFAFIPFAIAVMNLRNAFLSFFFGQIVGTFFYMLILYWIFPTVQAGTQSASLGFAAVTGLSLVLGLQFGIFALMCFYLKRSKWSFPFTAACGWVTLEWLHQLIAYKFMAFPWFVLGYTQFENISLIQIATFTGAYGVSFLIAFFGLSLGAICGKVSKSYRVVYFVLPMVVLITAFLLGSQEVKEHNDFVANNPQKLSVALMQPNTHKRMLKGEYEDITYIIAEQAEELKKNSLDLIIWPESSLPGTFAEGDYYKFIKTLSKDTAAIQITGSYFELNGKDYVSAALFDSKDIKDIYNKVKLVPFGEFLPFKFILGGIYEKNGIETFTGAFSSGAEPGKVLKMEIMPKDELTPESKVKTFLIGTNICFESLFPAIWRAQALSGAQFFVNMTNDGWFLDTAAPHQHLRINVFRAVETRLPILRAANTGTSAWISSIGEIRFKTQNHIQETALFSFYFQPRTSKTFYTKYGDVFAYICGVITITMLVFSIVFLGQGVRRYARI